MLWSHLRKVLLEELDPEAAERVERRLRETLRSRPCPSDTEILDALARHRWKVQPVADELGISVQTIYRRTAPKAPAKPRDWARW